MVFMIMNFYVYIEITFFVHITFVTFLKPNRFGINIVLYYNYATAATTELIFNLNPGMMVILEAKLGGTS